MPEHLTHFSFAIDHIVARKHGGSTVAVNLALSCSYCNSFKGTDATGFDPRTGRLARLFHPRRQRWERHFRWRGAILLGRTAIGRTTVLVLNINDPSRVDQRAALIAEGQFPLD